MFLLSINNASLSRKLESVMNSDNKASLSCQITKMELFVVWSISIVVFGSVGYIAIEIAHLISAGLFG